MTDLAALGLSVRSDGVVVASDRLDRFTGASDRAGKGADGLGRRTDALGGALSKLKGIIGPLAASLGTMFSVSRVLSAAEQYETRMARVQAVITATGGAAGRTAVQLEAQAQALARASLESVDGVMNAQQVLLTFRNVQGEVFDRAIEGAADLAAAMGQDIVSSTRQLARALEDPITGVTALTRSGTVFTEQQRDMIRAMVEAGRVADAQKFILDELEAQYGGVSRAASRLASAKDSLGQSVTNLLIGIADVTGATTIASAAIEALDGAIQFIQGAIEGTNNGLQTLGVILAGLASAQIPALVGALAAKTAGMGAAAIAAGALSAAAGVLRGALVLLGGPIGLVFAGLGSAAAWMLLFQDSTETAAPIIDSANDALERLAGVLAVSSEEMLPAAQRETLNLTNENIKLAKSAYAAAEAELAKAKAAAQYAQTELGLQDAFSPTGDNSQARADYQRAIDSLTAAQRGLIDAETQLSDKINEGQLALSSADDAMRRNSERALNLTVDFQNLADTAGTGGAAGAVDELTEAQKRAMAVLAEMNTDAVTQADVIGALDELMRSGAITADQYAEAVRRVKDEFAGLDGEAFNLNSSLAGVFTDALTGVKNLQDGLRDLLKQMASTFLNRAFSNILGNIFPSLSGISFGGGRERGGPVSAGTAYVVGEKRPELFVPGQSGTIIPQIPMGGGGTVVQVINNTGQPSREERQTLPDGRQIVRTIIGEEVGNGGIDRQMNGRFGLTPSAVRR